MRLAYIPPSAPVYLDLTGVRRNVALCIHPVGSERDGRVFGMQLHVDVGGAGNQRELVALAGIQPFALNADCPLGHFQRLQATIGTQNRFAGGQYCIRGVGVVTAPC